MKKIYKKIWMLIFIQLFHSKMSTWELKDVVNLTFGLTSIGLTSFLGYLVYSYNNDKKLYEQLIKYKILTEDRLQDIEKKIELEKKSPTINSNSKLIEIIEDFIEKQKNI